MAGVVSVSHHTIALAAETTSNTAAISVTDTTNCVPFITKRITTDPLSASNWMEQAVDADFLTSPNRVRVATGTAPASGRALSVEITVVEFDGTSIDVQQGTFSMDGSSLSDAQTISTIDQDYTFPYATHQCSSGNPTWHTEGYVRIDFTSDTEITLSMTDSSTVLSGHFYTVEDVSAGEFTVHWGGLLVGDAETTDTETIPSVTMAKTFILGSCKTNTQIENSKATHWVEMASPTTVTVNRHGTGKEVAWSGFMVTFDAGSDADVQRGTITGQGATALEDVNITAISAYTTSGMIINAGRPSVCTSGAFPGDAAADVPDAQCAWSFLDEDTIRVQHATSGGEADNDLSWEVIDWGLSAAEAARRVMVVS